jgi:hypothetical protein
MRLTNELRNSIVSKAVADLLKTDHTAAVRDLIQNVIVENMAPEVRAVWDNHDTRGVLRAFDVSVRRGNKEAVYIKGICGLPASIASGHYGLRVYLDEAVSAEGDSIVDRITAVVRASGLVDAQEANRELLASVKRRLSDALASVSTVKRLYDVLEPELHHLIPRVDGANLPVVALNVAEDLRKLGAELGERK